MKKLCAVLLCVCLLCLCSIGVQGSSIITVESIEDALTWPESEYDGPVCVVVGTVAEHMTSSHHDPAYSSQLLVEKVIYGEVDEIYIKKTNDFYMDTSDPTPGTTFLFLLQPSRYTLESGKVVQSDLYVRVGVYQGQFCFVNGELRGAKHLVDEILADDPTIDNMDELVHYFEKRIDALQREGKLPPDPVDWPGLLCAAGGLMLLGGLTVVLVYRRRRG